MADADNKTCSKCREPKPISEYRTKRSKGRKDYVSGYCRQCENSQMRSNVEAKKNKPSWREGRKFTQIKVKYKLSREQYIDMMLGQDFRCPICADPVGAGDWIVDHDHSCCPGEKSCGKCVRSLIDKKCNGLLGLAMDNVATLTRAQAYLEVHGA